MSQTHQNGHCVICNNPNYSVIYTATNNSNTINVEAFQCTAGGYKSHGQIVRCTQCDHMYTFPRLTNAQLLEAYTNVQDTTYVEAQVGRELTFKKHLTHLEKYTSNEPNRTLLDVGAYTGIFVQIANDHNWNAIGIEPSTWCTQKAIENNIPVIQGTLESEELQGKQFDAITMWDVIEHVDDPNLLVEQAVQLLKPGGILAVHTMDTSSIVAKILGHKWPWFMDMHVHYFCKTGLTTLIEDNGMTALWVGAEGRVLTVKYFCSRLEAFSKPIGKICSTIAKILHLESRTIPINFGDIITVYAQKN